MKIRTVLGIVVVLFLLPSCIAVPFLESARKAGLTEGDRMSLLGERLSKFNQAMSWDDPMPALTYVDDSTRVEMAAQFRKQKKIQRVVDVRVENIVYHNDATDADAEVTVRAFKIPYYVVEEKTEIQKWIFRASGGWMILSREPYVEPKGEAS